MVGHDLFTPAELERARAILAEHDQSPDLAARRGEVIAVDPRTGEVFIGGHTAGELMDRLRAEGQLRPMLYSRLGLGYYRRQRGGRKWPRES